MGTVLLAHPLFEPLEMFAGPRLGELPPLALTEDRMVAPHTDLVGPVAAVRRLQTEDDVVLAVELCQLRLDDRLGFTIHRVHPFLRCGAPLEENGRRTFDLHFFHSGAAAASIPKLNIRLASFIAHARSSTLRNGQ